MKKKIMVSCLTAAMSLALVVPLAFAKVAPAEVSSEVSTEVPNLFTSVETVQNDGLVITTVSGPIFTPFSSYQPVDQALTSSTGSQTVQFDPNSTYGYYRIYVANYSNVYYRALMTDLNHGYQGEFQIGANSSLFIRNTNKATTGRLFSVTSSDGSQLNGHVSVRLAETAGELQ